MRIHNLFVRAVAGIALWVSSAAAQNATPLFQYFQPPRGSGSFLGVFLQEVGPDRAKALKLPEEEGVEITGVEPNSPAAAAGLMAGDVVLKYNGQDVEGMEQFGRLVRETPAGREVKLLIVRNGSSQTVAAKIAARPVGAVSATPFFTQNTAPLEPSLRAEPPVSALRLFTGTRVMGVETEPLSGQLADYFGVKDGVLVRSVSKGSEAERAGIKAGDVITNVGGAKVTNGPEITAQLRAARGASVSVTLMRDHREVTVNLLLEGRDNGQRF
ncbi:MAG TPA: PDZ domain-containing protein [Bryobacteraceae bacterium]|nr:PDZ domain-containing protein [Bryobacteraceae bacterium]